LLALPRSNAPVERVFSIINALWSDEKTETLKALTIVKTHFKDFSCSEFFPNFERKSVSGTGSQI
jgi:hypothetical protein